MKKVVSLLVVFFMVMGIFVTGYTTSAEEIYVVSTSHLDTVWSWDLEQTIEEYLPQTFTENFDLMEDYPDYKFNFEGAYRYQLLEEYYPEMFETLKKYTENGQWNVSGSALENGDVNVPSPEALFRNVLYGNNYFEDEFNQRSKDIYLPDCFGFGYTLPSIIYHSNLQGFTTQKLSWGIASENGKVPFDVGLWKGPDGKAIIGDLNLNDYTNPYDYGFRNDQEIIDRLRRSLVGATTVLYGSPGDRGGAVPKQTVERLIDEYSKNENYDRIVKFARTDDFIKKLFADPTGLPIYDGELLMKQHGSGTYTSQTLSKRWNRQAELMAYAAEMSNVNSMYLGATTYPLEEFENYWTRVIAHQFHDDITGTSNAETYLRSRDDYMTAIKQFAAEYISGVRAVISGMDTTVSSGIAVVVNNPLAVQRTGTVKGKVVFPSSVSEIKVFDNEGNEVPSQILSTDGNTAEIVFIADVKPLGYRKYNITAGSTGIESILSVTTSKLSNERYDVTLNSAGDIASIYDKSINKELLAGPVRLALFNETDHEWPAWEIRQEYYDKAPDEYVGGTPQIKIVENGSARVALEVKRTQGGSTYTQIISLSAGGKMVEVQNTVDWQERGKLLKCEFNFTSANPNATYDLGLGTIVRNNNQSYRGEVPFQKWADLTKPDNSYGVSIVNDCKYGIDKLNDSTLRLTLIHTPVGNFYHSESYGASGQNQQDLGLNKFAFAIYGHQGTYADSEIQSLAEQFNQPIYAFQTDSHTGVLGSNYSFGSINNEDVIIRAIKKAEKSDEIIVRVNEGAGKNQSLVEFSMGEGIESAREVYASEEPIGAATVKNGKLVFDISKYGVKTFALTLKEPAASVSKIESSNLNLPYNIDAYSGNGNKNDGSFNLKKETFPSELVPETILFGGVQYKTGSKQDGQSNAVQCTGQTVNIPSGYKTLKFLAMSTNGDKDSTFRVNGSDIILNIGDYDEEIGAGDSYSLNKRGYVKNQTPAFVSTHRHTAGKDNIANTTYMFEYSLDIEGAESVILPKDKDIIIMSAVLLKDKDKQSVCANETNDERQRVLEQKESIDNGITFDDGKQYFSINSLKEVNSVTNNESVLSTEEASSGTTSLKLTGQDNSPGRSFVYYNLGGEEITVRPDTTLEYRFYAANELGRYVSVDMDFSGGTPLRDKKALSADGIDMHPSHAKGTVGQWVTIKCNIGAFAAGEKVTNVMIAYDNPPNTGMFTAYVDDIKIYTPSENLETLIGSVSDIKPEGYGIASYAELQYAYDLAQEVSVSPDATASDIKFAKNLLNEAYSKLTVTKDGTKPINAVNFDKKTGRLSKENTGTINSNIGGINNASSVTYRAVDFGNEPLDTITIVYSGGNTGLNPQITVIDGDNSGDVLGIVCVPETGGWDTYKTATIKLKKSLTGEHDITLNFKSKAPDTCNVRTIAFSASGDTESSGSPSSELLDSSNPQSSDDMESNVSQPSNDTNPSDSSSSSPDTSSISVSSNASSETQSIINSESSTSSAQSSEIILQSSDSTVSNDPGNMGSSIDSSNVSNTLSSAQESINAVNSTDDVISSKTEANPKTGDDNFSILLSIAFLAISASCIFISGKFKK